MALKAIDVQQKTFGTALRGYRLDDVDDFLDQVVATLQARDSELADAHARIAALEAEVSSLQGLLRGHGSSPGIDD